MDCQTFARPSDNLEVTLCELRSSDRAPSGVDFGLSGQPPNLAVSSSGGLASARESLCRGLGSRWFTERFHRNALVTHFQHGQIFCTARQLKDYAVTRCRLHQRAPQRRHPTDVVAVEIDLV